MRVKIIIVLCILNIIELTVWAEDTLIISAIPFAHLGLSYNISSGEFGSMLLEKDFPHEKLNVRYVSTEFKLVTSTKEALDLLDVGGSLSLDVSMAGGKGFDLSAAGNYLKDEGDRRDYAELLFSSKIQNYQYRVPEPKKNIIRSCKRLSDRQRGTHMITGISTGGFCLVSVKYWVTTKKSKEEIEASARVGLDMSTVSASASGHFRRLRSIFGKKTNITVNTYCSAVFGQLPMEPEEAISMTEDFLVRHMNQNPVGVPLMMRLLPLNTVPACGGVADHNDQTFEQKRFAESILVRLDDVKAAYQKLVSCTSKFPLHELKHADYLQKLFTEKRELRQLMIRFDDVMKNINKFSGNKGDVRRLKSLYHQDLTNDTLQLGESLWRDKIKAICHKLALVWSLDQPFNNSIRNDTPKTQDERNKCRMKNLILDAVPYYPSYIRTRSLQNFLINKNELKLPYLTIKSQNWYVFRLKKTAAGASYVNIETQEQSFKPPFLSSPFGLEVYFGTWEDPHEKIKKSGPNFNILSRVLSFPDEEEKKLYSDLYDVFMKKNTSAALKKVSGRKFVSGLAIRKKIDFPEPFGMVVIGSNLHANLFLSAVDIYGTECNENE